MKMIISTISLIASLSVFGSVPTEEGLLKNLNNAVIPGNLITVKAMLQNTSASVAVVGETEALTKADFYKFVISLENHNQMSLLQVTYSGSQMLNSQIKAVKYFPDLLSAIKKEKTQEKGMFYAVLMMLTTNNPQGIESYLEKNGTRVVKNKNVLNEEKMRLLRSYRTYLTNNKGKGDVNSPLNPTDPQNKAKVFELFRANTFTRSKNIELTKLENEFMWAVDWKAIKAHFSNEEKRLRVIEYLAADAPVKLEAKEYILFNGTNELPKHIFLKDGKGLTSKMQILGLDTKNNNEKQLSERYEEARKTVSETPTSETNYSFLF